MPDTPPPLPAELQDRFELLRDYGGGEGRTVLVAARPASGRPTGERLVLKLLPADAEVTEASLLATIRHPAIPSVVTAGTLADGGRYVVREHLEGAPLAALPRRPAELRATLQELLEALAFVHARGVLHLDLKPANLLRGDDGRLRILDFGLGTRRGRRAEGGTPFFASPEVLLGQTPDARSDLFAVGAMVVQALHPRERVALAAFAAAFPDRPFLVAAGLDEADLPSPFREFVARCVARRPSRRFPDAQAALEFLVGHGGRPSLELLRPDPAEAYAEALAAAVAADASTLAWGDAEPNVARELTLHLITQRPGVRPEEGRPGTWRLGGSGPHRTIALGPLTESALARHLATNLALEARAAGAAARWVLPRAARIESVHALLVELVRGGAVRPAGVGWIWPDAAAGRLTADPAAATASSVAGAATPESVYALASRGLREAAVATWHAAAGSDERGVLRRALVEGLLDAGDPAAALPWSADLPVHRAEALLDCGQVEAAKAMLAGVLESDGTPRHRRLAARLLLAEGATDAAVAMLEATARTVPERLTLAAALERRGDLAACESVLAAVQTELGNGLQPFAEASAHTVLGHVARRRAAHDRARGHFARAAEVLFDLGHARHAASAKLNLGVAAKDSADFDVAIADLRQARELFRHVGDAGGEATAEANLGIVEWERGDALAARERLRTATQRLRELGLHAAARHAAAMLARAYARLGDREAAERELAQLADVADDRVRSVVEAVRSDLAGVGASAAAAQRPTTMADDEGPSRALFRTFLAVNRNLAQATDLARAMQQLLDAAVTLSGGRRGYLLVVRDGGMRSEYEFGEAGQAAAAFSRSLAHRAIETQRTLTDADALADRDLRDAPSIRRLEIRSALCAPFRSAGGATGALYVEHPGRARAFGSADREALEALADQAAIAVDRMLREESMQTELQASRREVALARRTRTPTGQPLLGESTAMVELRGAIRRFAAVELPILITGETGVGKEVVARALHDQSARAKGEFVAENCAALPAELMERELFGHVAGAFTGADRDRPGLLELASGGTLFLDEVGEMPPALQAKLLRALQEQTIRRIGATESTRIDLRIVAATHRDLRALVAAGSFREDLFYRIAAVELRVPPLRERGDDVLLLAAHFAEGQRTSVGRPLRLGKVAAAALLTHRWPGNVRELAHVIARAALLCDGDEIVDLGLPNAAASPTLAPAEQPTTPDGEPAIMTLREAERRAIVTAMQACAGDKTKAARALGISRTALYEKLKRYDLA